MNDDSHRTEFKCLSWWKVFTQLFLSKGLVFVLFLAPMLWAFLPFAYEYIKSTDGFIRDNPMFLVFARMVVGCVWMLAALAGLWIYSRVGKHCQGRTHESADEIGKAFLLVNDTLRTSHEKWKYLLLLGVAYWSARALEMKCILGYHTDCLSSSALVALKDYGYFMGLMFAVPVSLVPIFFRKSTSLTAVVFGVVTCFLTVASGLLYVCGENPGAVLGLSFAWMTFIAVVVSVCTYGCSIWKGKGNLAITKGESPSTWSILVSSFVINLTMSLVTLVLAGIFCLGGLSLGWVNPFPAFGRLLLLYWRSEFFVPLWLVVGLGATVAAPVAQLFGVSKHDESQSSFAKYGVRGRDWLVICGGFEPLLVALFLFVARLCLQDVGWLQKCWDHKVGLYSNLLMLMAVLTVIVIALVKIAEVWSEKSAAIRNAIFRNVRGSSRDSHERDDGIDLKIRAIKLALLKLYDKREELIGKMVRVTVPEPMEKLKLKVKIGGIEQDLGSKGKYLVLLVHAEDYFSTDDPFTAEVLSAQEVCLHKQCPAVSCISLKWYVRTMNLGKDEKFFWRKIKTLAQDLVLKDDSARRDAMPFVVNAPNESAALAFANTWNGLLDEIGSSVNDRCLGDQVNGLICDFIKHLAAQSSARAPHSDGGAEPDREETDTPRYVAHRCFGMYRSFKILIMLLSRWIMCWEAVVLLLMVGLNFLLGAIFPARYHSGSDSLWWSFKCQLDLGTATDAFKAASGVWKAIPFFMHFSMWAIGSGVMFGAILSRSFGFFARLLKGDFRFRRCLRNHEILLGWDPNAVSHIRSIVSGRESISSCDFWSYRPQIVILSEQSADEIKRCLRGAFRADMGHKWPFKLIVYNGKYDDEREFKHLAFRYARSVQLIGEFREREHDSRVLVALARLDMYMADCAHLGRPLECHARIATPIVYYSVSGIVKDRYKNINVSFFNFHTNWAWRIWGDEYVEGSSRYAALNYAGGSKKVVLHIIGMGRMGIALAIQAMKKSKVLSTGKNLMEIVFVDPMADMLRAQFDAHFAGWLQEYPTCQFEYLNMNCDSSEYLGRIEEITEGGASLTVAVTMSNPGIALEKAIVVLRSARGRAQILLRQDVEVRDVLALNDLMVQCYQMEHVRLFGFQDGAGFSNAD